MDSTPEKSMDWYPDCLTTPSALAPNFGLLLWQAADRFGGRAAIIEGERVTNYGSLRDRAAVVASVLRSAKMQQGDRVGIFAERGAEAAAAFFGVLAAGGVAVNINERLRPRQVEYILKHADVRFLLITPDLVSSQPRQINTSAAVISLRNLPGCALCSPIRRIGSDVAQIIYTSGSTGQPKGVTLSHANLWAGARVVTDYLKINPDDRLASLLPFSFDYGLSQLLCAVGSGAALVVETSPIPTQVISSLQAHEVTVLAGVPPLWLQLLTSAEFTLQPIPPLRAMTNTGGRIPIEAVRRLRRAQPHAELFLMYGLTEAFRATYLPPSEVDRRPDSIGKAIPGAEILVIRQDGMPCGPHETGELVQRGPTVALGYWNDEQATEQVFRPHPLRPPGTPLTERVVYSGDLVRFDEDGFLYHIGRRDHMIKTLGFRVNPDEIVDVLYASNQIVEGVVTSEPDNIRGEKIVAHVVLAPDGSLEALVAFCRRELPRYMQPVRFELHKALLRTPSGKHDIRPVRNTGSSSSMSPGEVGYD